MDANLTAIQILQCNTAVTTPTIYVLFGAFAFLMLLGGILFCRTSPKYWGTAAFITVLFGIVCAFVSVSPLTIEQITSFLP